MPLVAAKCTQCGANIEVNPSHDAGICPHCGTAYVTEKVIKNYITNNNLNVGGVNIDKVNVSVPDHIEKVVKSYSAYMKKKEYEKGVPYKGFFETLKIYRKLHFKRRNNQILIRV